MTACAAKTFEKEADLCAAFLGRVPSDQGWTAYPETAGWDILLVHAEGWQIGIEAKLRMNLKVLSQALDYPWHDAGPDFRVLLLPASASQYRELADALGLGVITVAVGARGQVRLEPDLFGTPQWLLCRNWFYWNPTKRHTLPEYVPDVAAGVPSPVTLTKWKIRALKISAIIELRGYVDRDDFSRMQVDRRRWVTLWLAPVENRPGAWKWREGCAERFAAQHPDVYPRILADMAEYVDSTPRSGVQTRLAV